MWNYVQKDVISTVLSKQHILVKSNLCDKFLGPLILVHEISAPLI